MTKLKLSNQNTVEDTFNGKFYILKEGNLYNLILKDTHFSLASTPTLENALESLGKMLKRYKTYHNLLKVLNNMEYPPRVPTAKYNSRVKDYQANGDIYINQIEEVIESFTTLEKQEIKEKNKVKPIKVKKKLIIKKA